MFERFRRIEIVLENISVIAVLRYSVIENLRDCSDFPTHEFIVSLYNSKVYKKTLKKLITIKLRIVSIFLRVKIIKILCIWERYGEGY